MILFGSHSLKAYMRKQTIRARSSEAAKLYAAAWGASVSKWNCDGIIPWGVTGLAPTVRGVSTWRSSSLRIVALRARSRPEHPWFRRNRGRDGHGSLRWLLATTLAERSEARWLTRHTKNLHRGLGRPEQSRSRAGNDGSKCPNCSSWIRRCVPWSLRKDKLGGIIAARVLFDGTNGIMVNKRTRMRDQERAPIAVDLKRFTREKSTHDEYTFALTADATEAHRKIPIAPCDWYLLGRQVPSGSVYINLVGTFGVWLLPLASCRVHSGTCLTIPCGPPCEDLAHACCGRCSLRRRWT